MTKRRPITLLPSVHQTPALERFFGSTVDHLFEPGKAEPVSGYIGRVPSYNDPITDFYKKEPTSSRTRYQLETAMTSTISGELSSLLFYDDLVAKLGASGSLTNDEARLFKSQYWAWAPPIDIDKVNNYQQWYWSGADVPALDVILPGMDLPVVHRADGVSKRFTLPLAQSCMRLLASEDNEFDASPTVMVNGAFASVASFTANEVILDDLPDENAVVEVYRYASVSNGIRTDYAVPETFINIDFDPLADIHVYVNGREITEFQLLDDNTRVRLDAAASINSIVTVTVWDSLSVLSSERTSFDISRINHYGVAAFLNGLKVRLIDPVIAFIGFDVKPYDTFKWSESSDNIFYVDGVGESIRLVSALTFTGIDPQYVVCSRSDPAFTFWSQVNRWVESSALEWFGGKTQARQAKRPICEYVAHLQQWGVGSFRAPDADSLFGITEARTIPVVVNILDDAEQAPREGDIVLFGQVGNDELDNKMFRWPDTVTSIDDLIFIRDMQDGDIVLAKTSGIEYNLNGEWATVPERGEFPLFDLYDNDGISLGDTGIYPNSDFAGSRIFCYEIGEGDADPVLGFPVVYDTYGQLMFSNDLYINRYNYRNGEMAGYYYYRVGTEFRNQWYRAEGFLPSGEAGSIPLNLQANPNFETPERISRNNWFNHFASIVTNQDGFVGAPYSPNNWSSTPQDLSKGTSIIQSRAPLLKLMLLMSDHSFDLLKAISFAEREYTRLKLKIKQKISEGLRNGSITPASNPDTVLIGILKKLAVNKTADFAFYLSNIGGGNYFIPMTPSLMGITPITIPSIVNENDDLYLIGHDGSRTLYQNDIENNTILAFENMMFDHRAIDTEALTELSIYDLLSGKFRTSDYSREEFLSVMQKSFEDWARDNNLDYQKNDSYNEDNPFTWNYSASRDRDGDYVGGHWRSIYRHYFDTETPHSTPWEMLGFANKPTWWEVNYGLAPYLRENPMWEDIRDGRILEGDRAGVDSRFVRVDLMEYLPIDPMGNLLDPVTARIVDREPTTQFASQNWTFGDGSPVETMWRRSASYSFALAKTLFLLRPAQFVEHFWDTDNQELVHGDQWVNRDTNERTRHSDLIVHGELVNETAKISTGIQNYLSEYLIYLGQTPSVMGNLIRGLDVRLAHKVAGFTTSDRMIVSAESFGLVPSEDITISLYRTPSTSIDIYSGVIIEYLQPYRWRILGYNPTIPNFITRPGDTAGRKRPVVNIEDEKIINPWHADVYYKLDMYVTLNNSLYRCTKPHVSSANFEGIFWELDTTGAGTSEKIYEYLDPDGSVEIVPYSTIMTSVQEVVSFLFAYSRDLTSRGFSFPEASWKEAAEKFINWSSVDWASGAFIALSPAGRTINYETQTGFVMDLNDPFGGDMVVNRTGHSIDNRNLSIDRIDGTLSIVATSDDDIYGVVLKKSSIEHALVFSNRTIFDDIIYDPVFNVRQDRLKISARVTTDWNGRLSAPGFIISNGQIVSNFEKSSEDIRNTFDIEKADNSVLRDHARHLIGFEKRPYLSNLLLNDTQQFELYQGMIQQKGGSGSLYKILRSKAVEGNRDIRFSEEWAFRLGEFGANEPRVYQEIGLTRSDVTRQSQVIHLNAPILPEWQAGQYMIGDMVNRDGQSYRAKSTHSASAFDLTQWADITGTSVNNMINIPQDSTRWISPPYHYDSIMIGRKSLRGLPDAGYVRTNEATYSAETIEKLSEQLNTLLQSGKTVKSGESIWVYNRDFNGWSLDYIDNPSVSDTPVSIVEVIAADDSNDVIGTRYVLSQNHTFEEGDLVIINGIVLTDTATAGVFEVTARDDDWIEVLIDSGINYNYVDNDDAGPLVFGFRQARFANKTLANDPRLNGSLVYVDDSGNGEWAVYRAPDFTNAVRQQPIVVDSSKIVSALLYERGTRITETSIEPDMLSLPFINPVDPLNNIIVGMAEREIDYRLEYDPAGYGDEGLWTSDYIGRVWWDISTTWYIDPYTDATDMGTERSLTELDYRSNNWNRLAPHTSISLYEWTRSTTLPSDTAYDPDAFNTVMEFDAQKGRIIPVYYWWNRNPDVLPNVDFRKTDLKTVANILSNPTLSGQPWVAAIDHDTIMVSGIADFLNDQQSVLQLLIQDTDMEEEKPHVEWKIIRPIDNNTVPDSLWDNLRNSLCGVDGKLNPLTTRKGIGQRDTMFGSDIISARETFITKLNYLLASRNIGDANFSSQELSHKPAIPEQLWWVALTGVAELFPPRGHLFDETVYDSADLITVLEANPEGYRVMLDNRMGDIPSWSIWVRDANGTKLHEYDQIVPTRANLSELDIEVGQTILVQSDEEFSGFWTVLKALTDGFEVVWGQQYDTADFWQYADWYADGYSFDNPPLVIYDNFADRNQNETPVTNQIVKILDNGMGYWVWTAHINGVWETVAQQDGTIQLKDSFYTRTSRYGIDQYGDVLVRDGTIELKILIDVLRNGNLLTGEEKNDLFFTMINFVHSRNDSVDWAIKTSFLSVVGYNEELVPTPVTKPDNTADLLKYIDEVKPYRVTVREFSRNFTIRDLAEPDVTDFDKPLYFDETLQQYRTLDETNPSDVSLMEGTLWQHWYDNQDKARRMLVSMKFDRIWETDEGESSGAANRIMAFYNPTAGMPARDLTELLKLDFQGTILDGSQFGDQTVDDILEDVNALDGYALRDPRVSGNPEEMVKLGSHDAFLLQVRDKWGAGAPHLNINNFDVENEASPVVLDIDITARDVMVIRDGIRLADGEFVFDQHARTVTVNLDDSKTVSIYAFGYAGHSKILKQNQTIAVGGSETITMVVDEPHAFDLTLNGTRTPFVQTGQDVTFTGQSGDSVILTAYADTAHPTRMVKTILPARVSPILVDSATSSQVGMVINGSVKFDLANKRLFTFSADNVRIHNLVDESSQDFYSFTVLDAIAGTDLIVTRDMATLGAGSKYRSIEVRNLANIGTKTTIGQTGIYSGTVAMSGTQIPEDARVFTIHNPINNESVIGVTHNGSVMFLDLTGRVIKSFGNFEWTGASSIVPIIQSSSLTTVAVINTQRIDIIEIPNLATINIKTLGISAIAGLGTMTLRSAVYSRDYSLVIFADRAEGGNMICKYSLTDNTIKWTTWSGNGSPVRFSSPILISNTFDKFLLWGGDDKLWRIDQDGMFSELAVSTSLIDGAVQAWDDGFLYAIEGSHLKIYTIEMVDAAFVATYQLSGLSLNTPFASSMIVERNGLRLSPPRIVHLSKQVEVHIGNEILDYKIIDDAGLVGSIVELPEGDYTTVSEVLEDNLPHRYVRWSNWIILLDNDAIDRQYVLIDQSGDFDISPTGELSISQAHNGDEFAVTYWRNDLIMKPMTWVYDVDQNGTYPVRSRVGAKTLVSRNGRYLQYGLDYRVVNVETGAWGQDQFDTTTYSNRVKQNIVIEDSNSNQWNDRIVITVMDGVEAIEEKNWQLSTTTPDEYRFKIMDGDLVREPKAWELSHDIAMGVLSAEIVPSETIGSILVSGIGFDVPDDSPRVIWINGERIEYFAMTVTGSVTEFSEIRRGTRGTSKSHHAVGTPVRVQNMMRKVPVLPVNSITTLTNSPAET